MSNGIDDNADVLLDRISECRLDMLFGDYEPSTGMPSFKYLQAAALLEQAYFTLRESIEYEAQQISGKSK